MRTFAAALVLGLSLCATPAAPPMTTAGALVAGNGSLVIAGGALASSNTAVWKTIVGLRLPGRPVCVIPLASEQPDAAAKDVLAELQRAGGADSAVVVRLVAAEPRLAYDEAVVARLRRCGGFYFTGGDQSRIVDVLRPKGVNSEAHEAIADVLRDGGVVAGSSAGAAMMSHPMIGGGDSEPALVSGIVDRESLPGVWMRDGMGFLLHGLTDQHFLARGRLGRTLAALEGNNALPFAFGVDENTALVVHGSEVRVLGASGVVFVDLRGARREPGRRGFEGARLLLLGDGDRLDVRDGRVTTADDKTAPAVDPTPLAVPREPWQDDTFARVLATFATNGDRSIAIPAPPYALRLAKPDGFAARARGGRGPHDVPRALYAGPIVLDLVPINANSGPAMPAPTGTPRPTP